jgi:hypothetical protein
MERRISAPFVACCLSKVGAVFQGSPACVSRNEWSRETANALQKRWHQRIVLNPAAYLSVSSLPTTLTHMWRERLGREPYVPTLLSIDFMKYSDTPRELFPSLLNH